MAFTNTHTLMTMHGTSFGSEEFQCGIRFSGGATTQPDAAMALAVWTPTATAFGSVGFGINNAHVLTSVKLSLIGTDGLQVPGTVSVEHFGVTGVTGGGGASNRQSPQVAYVVTWTTAVPRGLAAKGRIYLPSLSLAVDVLGHTPGSINLVTVKDWIVALNAVSGLGTASVMSRIGSGVTRPITGCTGDNVYDVQRRRAENISRTKVSQSIP